MTDQIKASEDSALGSRLREVAPGEFAETVAIGDSATNSGLFFSTDNEMQVSLRTSVLRGETAGAGQPDATIWTTSAGSGASVTATASGEFQLQTSTSAAGAAYLSTTKTARHYPGTTGRWVGVVRLSDAGVAGNARKWGYFNDAGGSYSGFFFELNGTTFNLCYANANVITRVPWASANGVTANFNPATDLLNMNQFEIIHGALSCRWVINGRTVHTIGANNVLTQSGPLTDKLSYPMFLENVNSTNTTNVSLFTRGMSYSRLSPNGTVPRYTTSNTGGVLAATSLSALPTRLIGVVINAAPAASSTLTFYDTASGTGTVIAAVTVPTTAGPLRLDYGLETSVGLTVATTAALNFTVIFE